MPNYSVNKWGETVEPINMEIDGTQQQSAAPLLVEEATQEFVAICAESEPYDDEQPSYVPAELVKPWCSNDASALYHCYLIQMKPNFCYDIPVNDIVLGMRSELDCDIANMTFDLEVGRGSITVNFKKATEIHLSSEQVMFPAFQYFFSSSMQKVPNHNFRILLDHELPNLGKVLERLCLAQNLGIESIDYLLLPAARMHQRPSIIDWECVTSVSFQCEENSEYHVDCSPPKNCSRVLHTKNGMVCTCRIQNSLVYTPHTGLLYCITGLLDDLNGNSLLRPRGRRARSYKTHYEENNLYSFSFVPSIMHRLESLLLAVNLKRMVLDRCTENVTIPTIKVLEAITTKHCKENLHLESLEALGDSFLKYAASQQLFKTYQNDDEGDLTVKREKIISNDALCKFGCNRKLPGFIRNECFDPKSWIIPGDYSGGSFLNEELPFNERNIYIRGRRKVKSKRVADVVEALIGAFLSTGGEIAAIYFMNWVGIKVDLVHIPYERHFHVQPEKLIDVRHLESLLNNYSFRHPHLLLEALTHRSYMLPQIPGCYERLEFLGDAVLDYVITVYLYNKYPGMSPGVLTDMRSASVNNNCYALSAVKRRLHEHILAPDNVHSNIANTVNNFERLSMESTFGWESETSFSENAVFQSIRPLLEPLVSPETMPLNPVKEFHDYCQKMQYIMKKPVKSIQNGVATRTIEVEANGVVKYTYTSTASNNDTAKRLACKEFLSELDCDVANMNFDLGVGKSTITVNFKKAAEIHLSSEQVMFPEFYYFFSIIQENKLTDSSMQKVPNHNFSNSNGSQFAKVGRILERLSVDKILRLNQLITFCSLQQECTRDLSSLIGNVLCLCLLDLKKILSITSILLHPTIVLVFYIPKMNSLVYTPHTGLLYCITGLLNDLNGNSRMRPRRRRARTYKTHYEEKHGIKLRFDQQLLLKGKFIFKLQNYLQSCRQQTEKDSSHTSVELPPELCSIVMSPLSVSNLYSFSFVPSIMHRLESLLLAVNLKRMVLDRCTENVTIPTIKVLEAITTKHCQENLHLESLEALGDSFLKYAASQQLFKTYQNDDEGDLTEKKEKIISNAALCKLGCDCKLPGFIRNECFDPKKWIIPGDYSGSSFLNEKLPFNEKNIYIRGTRKIKGKRVADVVEALIGAFLSTGGEIAAIYFMNWVGIKVDLFHIPYERHFQVQPEKLIDVRHLEFLLNNYSFRDPSLLLEALTHGSYMLPQIPGCYERLEFLGDAVLDYVITAHLYHKYPDMSPGLLTDMRSASVNNICYARTAVRAGLHKHILASDSVLHTDIANTVNNFGSLSAESTFGWESETSFSEVLADIIESLAGAIFVDSEYDKNAVFKSIRPLLEPLVSPETVPLNPVKEFHDYCQKMQYIMKKPVKSIQNGVATRTIEVEANGVVKYTHTSTASNNDTAKRLACREFLSYVPAELVKPWCSNDASVLYHCYLIQMKQNFCSHIPVNNVVLGLRSELNCDIANMNFDLVVDKGTITVNFKKATEIHLSSEQVLQCRRFQITIFRILVDCNLQNLKEVLERLSLGQNLEVESINYLLLPAARMHQKPLIIDWECVMSVPFRSEENSEYHIDCSPPNNCSGVLHTKNGMVCTCRVQNSLVYTPHTSLLYCITGLLDDLNGNSLLRPRGRRAQSKPVELPPELCSIVMSPLSISNLYSFSIVPSIMYRLESLLLALNLKNMILDRCTENVTIPTIKVLEAITTKGCQENFNLESLETLGDSFLKYATSQQLFKTYQNNAEGLLSGQREKIVSNPALCKFGCDRKLPGFIRNECFDPKKWTIPGDYSGTSFLSEDLPFNERNIYIRRRRKVKDETVADVVEALIGAFLSTGGEIAAIYFMNWVGIKVDLVHIPYERHFQVQPEKLIDVRYLKSLLNYSFRDPSLLLEALTHSSCMLPKIPGCYERLEFLGDAVLDYVITFYLYNKYRDMSSPGFLTDMRSASVNNDCYALSAVKAGLHKHILASDNVDNDIANTVNNFGRLSIESTFGWEIETYFSEVLADIIESLAGAIFVDSEYDKDIVFQSIRPLLEPLVTPETMPLNHIRESKDICQKMHYIMKKPVIYTSNGVVTRTIEVEAKGAVMYKHTSTVSNNKTAEK
ncbi:dicer-like 2, partial [Prunus dulcis]